MLYEYYSIVICMNTLVEMNLGQHFGICLDSDNRTDIGLCFGTLESIRSLTEPKCFLFSGNERMTRNETTGGTVVTSTEHTEGHEVMDLNQISDEGITTGHGTLL
jgi:hypothetical protein